MSFEVLSDGPEATARLGELLAKYLAPGDIVLLVGDLGAGKTALAKAIAKGLGVVETVTSPTFAVANRYQGRVPVAHLDGYRLEQPDDEEFGLALEIIGEDSVALIEWPDALSSGLPPAVLTVSLSHRALQSRLLAFSSPENDRLAEIERDVANAGFRYVNRGAQSGADPSGATGA